MRIKIHAVGTKMPSWVAQGYADYAKRMPREMAMQINEIPLAKRHKNANAEQMKQAEGKQLLARVNPPDTVIALEVQGIAWTTQQLAQQLSHWRAQGNDVVFVIGGPDGLSEQCLKRADNRWSLSTLTLPHPLVRVILAEQLYRAWTVLQRHPYHRE